ncbi:MAG: hypothetical protein DMG39_28560 [Acidobacteria bacterium]|nr:MAG: hypothetical protein DMG39_28560 [Acidobacteriota bacterium]
MVGAKERQGAKRRVVRLRPMRSQAEARALQRCLGKLVLLEEIVDLATESFSGVGLVVFASVKATERRMAGPV